MINKNTNKKNNTNKKDTMTIKNKQTQETLQNFILRGGKLQILPAQKSNYKHVCNCSSKYVLSSKFSASSVHKNSRRLAA
jgi:hypothetical protein